MAIAVPLLASLPGAPVDIYLDFDGHSQREWGVYENVVSPPFDQDGKHQELNSTEVAAIREIWARVAEDYAPFNVNVTTVDPKDYSNGRAVHVIVGGHYNDWYRIRVGGVSFANSFVNSMPNVVFVFSKALGGGAPKYVADLISHEVGHTFGLEEQSVYDERGARIRDYNTGDARLWGPLMGNSLAANRSIWHYGTSTSHRNVQDDVAIIARRENGFGLRPDDHADEAEFATDLRSTGARIDVSGVIGNTRDSDCFRFETSGGRIRLKVQLAEFGPNLDAKLELRDEAGKTIAIDEGESRLDCELETELAAGSYCAVVRSHGSYGDLGQYRLVGASAPLPAAVATQVALAKRDAAPMQESQPNVTSSVESSSTDESVAASENASSAIASPVAGPATR